MFTRYAIYFVAQGAFADRGAAWLGWDIAQATRVARPPVDGVDVAKVTARPAKYGFHGTIKAPFYLAGGYDEAALGVAFKDLCSKTRPIVLSGLKIATLGRFLAFVPIGDTAGLNDLAAGVVSGIDPFRAPPTEAELARRRKANLSPAQEANLVTWGYPHVMDTFRFHMTLTGPVPRDDLPATCAAVQAHFDGCVPNPMPIDSLALVGEGSDGQWQMLTKAPLGQM